MATLKSLPTRQRGSNVSHEQKEVLLEFMTTHEDLRKGAFKASFTKKDQERQWQEISDILNAMPGATKEWVKWRKAWQDYRSNAKKTFTSIKTSVEANWMSQYPTQSRTENGENDVDRNAGQLERQEAYEDEEYLDDLELGEDFYDLEDEFEIDRRYAAARAARNRNHEYVPESNRNAAAASNMINPTNVAASANRSNVNTANVNSSAANNSAAPKTITKSKSTAVKRLDHTIVASAELSKSVKEKTQMKKEYYDQKLALLKLQVHQQIASSVKEICDIVRNYV